jgi:uncharacterized DUF497 family protein
MEFEWDVRKAEENFEKHGVRSSEALPVFDDDHAITIADDESDSGEQRYISIGMGLKAWILVVVYCWREKNIRIISARMADAHESRQYEEPR